MEEAEAPEPPRPLGPELCPRVGFVVIKFAAGGAHPPLELNQENLLDA